MDKKVTRYLSRSELQWIAECLERLAAIYEALGFPEDARLIRAEAQRLMAPDVVTS